MPVLPLTITTTGISGPDYPTILASLQSDFQSIYGSDIDIAPDTQDGQMIAIFAQAIYDCYQSCIATYNSFSPSTAQGVGLSSIIKINGLTREVPTNSQANITIVGVYGIPITNGIIGDNLNLNTQWALPALVTIPIGGSIVVTATCTAQGSTLAAPGTLTVILTPTFGWQSATNVAAATAGNPVESDAALRQRQSTSTSLSALTNLQGIFAAIQAVQGVTELKIYQNDTNSTDGNGVPGHSISAVVNGGDATAIATAIAQKKAPGTGTYGNISEVIIDPNGIPDTIEFYALTVSQVDVVVSIIALTNFTTTTEALIQEALAAFVSELNIGEISYFRRLFAPANLEGDAATTGTGLTQAQLDTLSATYTIVGVAQCLHSGTPLAADLAIAFNAQAACIVANVTVNVVTLLAMVSTPSTLHATGNLYSQTNVASAGTSTYSYWYAGTLPNGCTINTTTGTVSGTPGSGGAYSYQVTATDSGVPPQYITNTISGTIS